MRYISTTHRATRCRLAANTTQVTSPHDWSATNQPERCRIIGHGQRPQAGQTLRSRHQLPGSHTLHRRTISGTSSRFLQGVALRRSAGGVHQRLTARRHHHTKKRRTAGRVMNDPLQMQVAGMITIYQPYTVAHLGRPSINTVVHAECQEVTSSASPDQLLFQAFCKPNEFSGDTRCRAGGCSFVPHVA